VGARVRKSVVRVFVIIVRIFFGERASEKEIHL